MTDEFIAEIINKSWKERLKGLRVHLEDEYYNPQPNQESLQKALNMVIKWLEE